MFYLLPVMKILAFVAKTAQAVLREVLQVCGGDEGRPRRLEI